MGRAHSSEKGWTLGSQGANGSPELVSAALVDPQRGGQTILNASQVAAGSKRHRTVEFGTPYKRPMSSSGRLWVDMMMMMMMIMVKRCIIFTHQSTLGQCDACWTLNLQKKNS
ncbi:jg9606 [Pararge aegeria aegeria]|uniref:Jg9606 protein n=1 Tax=Pararge aegeria aegeria TaxID=348720 RepID=A0A8S4RT84_9NEOP|nr:jg9606 [Pararge aegeria aegeria]